MKEKIIKILQRYDQPTCDPHYSGIEPEQFDELSKEICELYKNAMGEIIIKSDSYTQAIVELGRLGI